MRCETIPECSNYGKKAGAPFFGLGGHVFIGLPRSKSTPPPETISAAEPPIRCIGTAGVKKKTLRRAICDRAPGNVPRPPDYAAVVNGKKRCADNMPVHAESSVWGSCNFCARSRQQVSKTEFSILPGIYQNHFGFRQTYIPSPVRLRRLREWKYRKPYAPGYIPEPPEISGSKSQSPKRRRGNGTWLENYWDAVWETMRELPQLNKFITRLL